MQTRSSIQLLAIVLACAIPAGACLTGESEDSETASELEGALAGCKHDVCTVGGKLRGTCDACVPLVCDVDPSCCKSTWDAACVALAETECGKTCGGGAGGSGSSSSTTGSTSSSSSSTSVASSSASSSSSSSGGGGGEASLDPEEQSFLVTLNDYRAQNGLGPLSACSSLNSAAQLHSEDMRDNNYFSHTGLNGSSPWDRSCLAGYLLGCGPQTAMGENLAAGNSTATATFGQWKNSPGHNANMLGSSFVVIGIGRATGGGTYGTYWTTVFGGATEASCN
jgi:uncharacterized protein YkwD